jgi:hypothetical protein
MRFSRAALPEADTSEEADERIGYGSGDPPHEARWLLRPCGRLCTDKHAP